MSDHHEELDRLLEEDQRNSSTMGANKRKARTSNVPEDYDPTPDYYALPEGVIRPPSSCWVDRSLVKPLELKDLHHLWVKPTKGMEEAKRKKRFLASKLVLVGGEFWIKDKQSGLWVERKKMSEIISSLMHDWGRDKTQYNIRKETISDFKAGNEFVTLDGTLYVPGGGDFVEFQGRRYLNTYHQQPLAFTEGTSQSPEFKQLMELIVHNLMGKDVGNINEWTSAIHSDENSDIKWLFHWLASQYQRQGKMLPTAVWIVGSAQGVGKGLLASGMKQLLGASNVKTVSSEEFQGGWTDFVLDASFIVLDEVDFGSRTEAYDKIKRLIGNEITAARKRNHGDIIVPSVCNFLFTTNRTNPVAMDRGDRRNTVFGTKNTQAAKDRAQAFYNLPSEAKTEAWKGLAEFLAAIQIDDKLISHAFHTEIKERMIENNINPVEEWLLSDDIKAKWPINHFAPSDWLYRHYADWMQDNDGFHGCITRKYFQTKMGDMNDLGLVSQPKRKTLKGDTKYRGYIRYDPDHPATNIEASELPFISEYQKDAKLIQMRDNMKRKGFRIVG
ncbi:MAG: primase-helicase family protein [Lentilitoribacter sp.]